MFKPGVTVWYNVKSLERTMKFYTDQMGFGKLFYDQSSGMAMVNTNTPDCIIGFSEAQEVIPSTSSTVFEVADIEKSIHTLTERGVSFTGGIDVIPGMVKLATFADPDGHNLMLAETLSPL